MSGATHTPGPYYVAQTHGHHCVVAAKAHLAVALVGFVGADDDAESQANAALFSAAPDLLSLLQDAVTAFGPHIEGGDDEWLTFAKAAIAKATGSAA